MKKALFALFAVLSAVSAFAAEYVVYQGRMKGRAYNEARMDMVNYKTNFILVVRLYTDDAMFVEYGKGADGGWAFADIIKYDQDEEELFDFGKDEMTKGFMLSWHFNNSMNEHIRLIGQVKTTNENFDWPSFFASSTKWPKMPGALAGGEGTIVYGTVSASPLVALSRQMDMGSPMDVLANYIASKNKMNVQEVKDEIYTFFPPISESYVVIDLITGSTTQLSSTPADILTNSTYKTTKMVCRRISSGGFTMGSLVGELGRSADETQHTVTLTKDFYIGVFGVTQKQYQTVMGTWPSYFNNTSYRDTRPVEQVSWSTVRGGSWPGGSPVANSFMGKLSTLVGAEISFDLPTEAQWEYACRAGTTTALNSGNNLTATDSCSNMAAVGRYWYNGGSSYTQNGNLSVGTAAAGSYLPNAWGLYDMHGNVWEWCLDWYGSDLGTSAVVDPAGAPTGTDRVRRGGSWSSDASRCRSASRHWYAPANTLNNLGFRAVFTPPDP